MSNDFNKFNMLSIRNKRKRIVWAEYCAFFPCYYSSFI